MTNTNNQCDSGLGGGAVGAGGASGVNYCDPNAAITILSYQLDKIARATAAPAPASAPSISSNAASVETVAAARRQDAPINTMDDATSQAILSLLQRRIQPNQVQQQQQQQLLLQPGPSSLVTVALDRQANAQAQALLLHHEERLRATRLLLEQHQGNSAGSASSLQHHSLLMATDAMTAAKVVQERILGVGAASSNNQGLGQLLPSISYTRDGTSDIRNAPLLSGQKKEAVVFASPCNGQIDPGVTAAAPPSDTYDEEPNQIDAAEGDDEKEFPENDVDVDNEGYDDIICDEEYFENFGTQDDNRVIQETFPLKLYRMLFEVEKSHKENIVSFLHHGKSFVVHKPKAFVEEIMPKYFTTCRLASFQRQLNLYGFRRITEGQEKGAYSHNLFLKGKRALCRKVKRQKTRVKTSQHQSCRALDTLASSSNQAFVDLRRQMGFPGMIASAAAAREQARRRTLLTTQQQSPAQALRNSTTTVLANFVAGPSGSFPAPGALVNAAVTHGDVGYEVIRQALCQGLLADLSNALQHQSNGSTGFLSNQDLQQKLQEREAEMIVQRLRQHQQEQVAIKRQFQPQNQQG